MSGYIGIAFLIGVFVSVFVGMFDLGVALWLFAVGFLLHHHRLSVNDSKLVLLESDDE